MSEYNPPRYRAGYFFRVRGCNTTNFEKLENEKIEGGSISTK